MAMKIPKSGFRTMFKEGTQYFEGVEETVLKNIDAVNELNEKLKTSFGPNGTNKMIINHLEKLFVTKDAATMLHEMEIIHPAAKLVVLASEMQEQQIGDNTNYVVILSSALLLEAAKLFEYGLSMTQIVDGFERALKVVEDVLPGLTVKTVTDLSNIEDIRSALKASITSKQYDNEDLIADLVSHACIQTLPKNAANFNVDNIRIVKILGSGIHDSKVVNGMVFHRKTEGEITKAENCRVAVFACPFDVMHTETKGTILMNNAEDLLNFSKNEEALIEKQIKELADAGVNVVVAAGKFGDLHIHFLNKYKIMGVRLVSKFDLRRLCKQFGAQAQARICCPPVASLGQCDKAFVSEIGATSVIVFSKESEYGNISTIVVRASSKPKMDDIERALDDAINTYKCLSKDARLLPGAGACEIALARIIREKAHEAATIGREKKLNKIEHYCYENYANAFEAIPKQFMENLGLNPVEIVAKVYKAHEEGNSHTGLNVFTGELMDAVKESIYDPYLGKLSAIRLATEVTLKILQIDKIIMAKRAGGPQPRGPKPQDEDDDCGGMA
ncbi:Cct8 protein [Strongyloides ratti]|uniref:T-complex protein 1 subunit theta n=1 Tax=Strongyloides ratti TaxID=34506 RepID=A0A090L647_STRRB|nr:Cct8 protein [Strongyloides ratti]CEF62994.1 Cct8 protein [Strongyloides ratti]